jgi:hypothetical protein
MAKRIPKDQKLQRLNPLGHVAYGRTALGQAVYDVLMSSMTAEECHRRHPDLSRNFILQMRKDNREMRAKKK